MADGLQNPAGFFIGEAGSAPQLAGEGIFIDPSEAGELGHIEERGKAIDFLYPVNAKQMGCPFSQGAASGCLLSSYGQSSLAKVSISAQRMAVRRRTCRRAESTM